MENNFCFLILSTNNNLLSNTKIKKFKQYTLYYNDVFFNELIIKDDILFYGYIIDPLNPTFTNLDIINDIHIKIKNNENFLETMNIYSGRYLIIKDNICITDACGLRQLFWYRINDIDFILSTSEKLIQQLIPHTTISDKKKKFTETNYFKNQQAFIGFEGIIDNSKFLLPNHFLNLNNFIFQRYPLLNIKNKLNNKLIIQILEGSYKAIHNRFGDNLLQGQTAGQDSRLLSIFASNYNIKCFHAIKTNKIEDYTNAQKVCVLMNLDLIPIKRNNIKPSIDFLKEYNNMKILPYYKYPSVDANRMTSLNSVAPLYYKKEPKVFIYGQCSEIVRSYFSNKHPKNSSEFLEEVHLPKCEYTEEFCNKYFDHSNKYCKDNNIYMSNLFYWEQRVGFWFNQVAQQTDMLGNLFVPYNNRILLTEFFKYNLKGMHDTRHFIDIYKELNKEDLLKIKFIK